MFGVIRESARGWNLAHGWRWYQLLGTEFSVEMKLAPQVGLEPTTLRLTAECSTIELLRSIYANDANCIWRAADLRIATLNHTRKERC